MEKGDYAIQISKYPKVVIIHLEHPASPGYWVADHADYTHQDIYFIPESDLKKLERRSLKERKARVVQIPWVSKLEGTRQPCAADTAKGKPCSRDAEFHFKRHKDSDPYVVSANYCWTHLIYRGLVADMTEEARTNAWERKQFFANL